MSLHVAKDWNYHAVRDRGSFHFLGPPSFKLSIRFDVVFLNRAGCFAERVGRVSPHNQIVLEGRDRVENASSVLVHTRGIGVVQRVRLTATWRSITRAPCLLLVRTVRFDAVRPNKIEEAFVW